MTFLIPMLFQKKKKVSWIFTRQQESANERLDADGRKFQRNDKWPKSDHKNTRSLCHTKHLPATSAWCRKCKRTWSSETSSTISLNHHSSLWVQNSAFANTEFELAMYQHQHWYCSDTALMKWQGHMIGAWRIRGGHVVTDETWSGSERGFLCHRFQKSPFLCRDTESLRNFPFFWGSKTP